MGQSTRYQGIASTILRSMFIWGLLSLTAWYWSERLLSLQTLALRWLLESVTGHYVVNSLEVVRMHGEFLFQTVFITDGLRVVGHQAIPAGHAVTSSTLGGHSFQPALIALPILLVWPRTSFFDRAFILLIALMLTAVVALLDTAIVLIGAAEDLVLHALDPDAVRYSFTVQAMQFLNGGGRLGLGLAIAAIASKLRIPAAHRKSLGSGVESSA